MKATVKAPSNIAFIKYWGRKDEKLRLPENASIAMNLSGLYSTTTVEFNEGLEDDVLIDGIKDEKQSARVTKFLNIIRDLTKINLKAKVASQNSFPSGTGLSSSASGFAALAMAGAKASGLSLTTKELSILARQGSGSACRSIPDGIVEWHDGDTSDTAFAETLFDENYWDISDVVAITNTGKKDVSTTEGHKTFGSSIFYKPRLENIQRKLANCKTYIKNKDFTAFGELVEAEALELHAVMLTSLPSLIYWVPGTLEVMKAVKKWRHEGLEAYFTINTGQDVHVICESKNVDILNSKLSSLELVKNTIISKPAKGARLDYEHLF